MKKKKRKLIHSNKNSSKNYDNHTIRNSNSCNDDSNNSNNQSSDSNSSNINSNSKKSKLCYFSALDYFILASTLAIALSEELSDDDIDILSTFLAVLSDQLALIANVNACSQGEEDNVFVPPIPAVSSSANRNSQHFSKKNHSKKIVKRKIKKK